MTEIRYRICDNCGQKMPNEILWQLICDNCDFCSKKCMNEFLETEVKRK